MIKVEHGAIELRCPKEDLNHVIKLCDCTLVEAAHTILGADLATLFYGLVDSYSLDDAMQMWTAAIETYKDLLTLKGDTTHDDN